VLCFITDKGIKLLADLDAEVVAADEAAVCMLDPEDQRLLMQLLDSVRAGHARAVTQPAGRDADSP
jgi:hypothetical protein